MSWFTDIVQDFYNLQVRLQQAQEATTKQAEKIKKLEAEHKECSREKE